MVDSGCTSSVCSIRVAERLKELDGTQVISGEQVNFKLADGTEQKSTTRLSIYFEQLDWHQEFHILDVAVGAIIGLDFMESIGAKLDFAKNVVAIREFNFPLIPYCMEDHANNPTILLTAELPPETEIVGDDLPSLYPMGSQDEKGEQWQTATIGMQYDSKIKEKVRNLLQEFKDIFWNQLPTNHECKLQPFKILLNDNKPVRTRPYRYSIPQLREARRQVEELVKSRAIEPCSSPYSSSFVLVTKKDKAIRMCIDYRKLNEVTVSDSAWIPRMETHLHQLGQSTIFSTLDMTTGYHQIQVSPESRPLTAFSVDDSGEAFQWRRLPFGLKNAPVHLMRSMSQVLRLPFVLVYIDDIIIHSANEKDHLQHVRKVLSILRGKKIILKPKKCVFFSDSVTYLGHVITKDGIRPLPEKFLQVTSPTTKTEARSLLGLLSFYRKFVKNFALNTQHMQRAVKESPFLWPNECQQELDLVLRKLNTSML